MVQVELENVKHVASMSFAQKNPNRNLKLKGYRRIKVYQSDLTQPCLPEDT